jgi:hypothetical protein
MLDLVNPSGTDGRLFGSGRYAWLDSAGPFRRPLRTPLHAPENGKRRAGGQGLQKGLLIGREVVSQFEFDRSVMTALMSLTTRSNIRSSAALM